MDRLTPSRSRRMSERGRWRPRPRRQRPPAALDLRRRTADKVSETKVRDISGSEEGEGTEEEDAEWHFVGDCGRRLTPDPAADLRPI
jgi:hypothetical protein